MGSLYHIAGHDLTTFALYTAFMAYCLAEFVALRRRGVSLGLASPVWWVLSLAVVFQLCSDTGYLADYLQIPPPVEHGLHVGLNAATVCLVAWSIAARPLRRIGRAEHRAEAAETLAAEIDEVALLDARLVEATFEHIHSAIYQVCKFDPDESGPLVGPDGRTYDLVIVAATPGMRAFFHVPEDAPVRHRSHYEVYPGIYDPTTGEHGRGDWLGHHAQAMHGAPVHSTDDGDSFDGPFGRRHFRWNLWPLLRGSGPAPGMAAGLLMEIIDRTEITEAEARADYEAQRREAETKRADHYVQIVDRHIDAELGSMMERHRSGTDDAGAEGHG